MFESGWFQIIAGFHEQLKKKKENQERHHQYTATNCCQVGTRYLLHNARERCAEPALSSLLSYYTQFTKPSKLTQNAKIPAPHPRM